MASLLYSFPNTPTRIYRSTQVQPATKNLFSIFYKQHRNMFPALKEKLTLAIVILCALSLTVGVPTVCLLSKRLQEVRY
jgi:hypothetical protein